MFDITQLLFDLAEERSIFHSEADLQHALAWKVREAGSDVRLEFPYQGTGTDRRYLDIWLPQEGIAVELKYCTRLLEMQHKGEGFALRDQRAQDGLPVRGSARGSLGGDRHRGRGVDDPGGADEESGRAPRAVVGAGAGDVRSLSFRTYFL